MRTSKITTPSFFWFSQLHSPVAPGNAVDDNVVDVVDVVAGVFVTLAAKLALVVIRVETASDAIRLVSEEFDSLDALSERPSDNEPSREVLELSPATLLVVIGIELSFCLTTQSSIVILPERHDALLSYPC
jgi:hypothetical protein